jgi:hypothetical protein
MAIVRRDTGIIAIACMVILLAQLAADTRSGFYRCSAPFVWLAPQP